MKKQDDIVGVVSHQKDYTIEAKYSKEAIEKKLIRFTLKGSKKSFEISADDILRTLVTQVNEELLAPAFVETTRINVVNVGRQVAARLDRDYKKGEIIRINYSHPYPLEFAIIEEAMKIAIIDEKRGYIPLTKEFIDEVKAKIQPRAQMFAEKFNESLSSLKNPELKAPENKE